MMGIWRRELFENTIMYDIGQISFEIYLVHAFTLSIIRNEVMDVFGFCLSTLILSVLLHKGIKWINRLGRGKING